MANTTCGCGAKTSAHPVSGYSETGACLEALKVVSVVTACDWPGCGKRVRKSNLGVNLCRQHAKDDWNAFMGMLHIEGPQALSRPVSTVAEREEFWRTGKLPASRLVPLTFETTMTSCSTCGGPLIVFNDADWSPDLPNALSCRDQSTPWGVSICPHCTFGAQAVSA